MGDPLVVSPVLAPVSPRSPSRRWQVREEDVESSSEEEPQAADRDQRLIAALPPTSLQQPLFCLSGPWGLRLQLQGFPKGLLTRLDLRHDPPQLRGRGELQAGSPWGRAARLSAHGVSSVSSPIVRFGLCVEPAPGDPRRDRSQAWQAECVVVVDRTGNYFAGTYQAPRDPAGAPRPLAGALSAARLPAAVPPGAAFAWPPRPCEKVPLMISERPASPPHAVLGPTAAEQGRGTPDGDGGAAPGADYGGAAGAADDAEPVAAEGGGDVPRAAVPRRPSGPPSGRPGGRRASE
eukprot:TRINITY_DN7330_c0_g1_i1.p1 TRINITY_DN7330_c0_g1~~TRINITY_DN7330_c0_g1_i1.p1  ORF type:complete len:292 (+),score=76.65 TRINITY_DN7330_c0_g1_i1:94-969(+)